MTILSWQVIYMKKIAIILVCIITLLFSGCSSYMIATEDTYIPYSGGIDIYHATKEELTAMDLCNYTEKFGVIENEKEAYQVAAKVIEEVYGKDESPYIVKYNEVADTWIVSGSLPFSFLGGFASIAIEKDTGAILMLIHTK